MARPGVKFREAGRFCPARGGPPRAASSRRNRLHAAGAPDRPMRGKSVSRPLGVRCARVDRNRTSLPADVAPAAPLRAGRPYATAPSIASAASRIASTSLGRAAEGIVADVHRCRACVGRASDHRRLAADVADDPGGDGVASPVAPVPVPCSTCASTNAPGNGPVRHERAAADARRALRHGKRRTPSVRRALRHALHRLEAGDHSERAVELPARRDRIQMRFPVHASGSSGCVPWSRPMRLPAPSTSTSSPASPIRPRRRGRAPPAPRAFRPRGSRPAPPMR